MTKHKICTIVTDASFCAKTNVAGWACWVVYDGQREKRYGAFKGIVQHSGHAEIKAILNGLYIAKQLHDPQHYHVVSDCLNAMDNLKIGREKVWRRKMLEIIGESNITFKHVKAHTNVQDARSFVNRWCDEHAKKSMKEKRAEILEIRKETE